ncbi:hypothetical protein CNMCM6069_002898 [Aspergillus lentulus]|nr:hypothetical protein CNMCM6069_002898 [Aspergillus lentulus]
MEESETSDYECLIRHHPEDCSEQRTNGRRTYIDPSLGSPSSSQHDLTQQFGETYLADFVMNFVSRNRVTFEILASHPTCRPRLIFNPFHVPSSQVQRRTMSSSIEQKLKELQKYSACDVSDALLKQQKLPAGTAARAGHLADFSKETPRSSINSHLTSTLLGKQSNPLTDNPAPFSPTIGRNATQPKIIAPASTFKFISKDDRVPPSAEPEDSHGFPAGTHWVDFAKPGTIAVLEQPADQHCAVLGGIMAVRMKVLGVRGLLVNGRVRDLAEINECKLPVWAKGTSTVGSGAEAKPGARDVPVDVGGVTVSPGDIIFCDPLEGVVAIPQELLDQVLELMPKLVAMDDKVKDAVSQGMNVSHAFKQFRTKP